MALAEHAPDDLAGSAGGDTAARTSAVAGPPPAMTDEPSHPVRAGTSGRESSAALPDVGSLRDAGATPQDERQLDSGGSRTARVAGVAGVTRAAAARARKNARRKGRTRRRVAVAGVCLPAIVVAAAMAYTRHPGSPRTESSPGARVSPAGLSASQTPPATPGKWQHIANRAGDPAPLTLSQLFPAHFTVGSTGYTRTAERGSADCSRAVFGTKLQTAVRKYRCSQVMRASYLASDRKLMGTIGVLNVKDFAAADNAGKVAGSSQFIAQLAAASGPTRRLSKGTGLEEAEVKGHYLILTWAEFTNLRAPGTASQRAQLRAFSANLISRTANMSLTSRMVTGNPGSLNRG